MSPDSLPAPPLSMLLGVPFAAVTLDEAITRIEQMIATRQPHQLVTANVDFLVQALHDPELHRIFLDAHLVLCDGAPLVWASRLFGRGLPERVAGADLAPLLFRRAEQRGYRIFFLGGAPAVAAQAVANLHAKYPALNVAGFFSPPFSELLAMDHDEINQRIKQAHPDILLVSFGCPKAEKWIAMNYRSLGVPVVMGVGATIDFLAGNLKRAPGWMQRSGAEWIFRLLQEPKRLWRRYARDLRIFGIALLRQWRHTAIRCPGSEEAACYLAETCESWRKIVAASSWGKATRERSGLDWTRLADRHCLLDLSNVRHLDGDGLALLFQLKAQLGATGHTLVLLRPSTTAKNVLMAHHLETYFLTSESITSACRNIRTQVEYASSVVALGAGSLLWRGEITAANVPEIAHRTGREMEMFCPGNSPVTVDLSQVCFIDSAGIHLMQRLKQQARQHGSVLNFARVSPKVRQALCSSRVENQLLGEVK